MKKLSILIALMLVLTIGGVYATWSYAGTNDIADAFAEAKVTIADSTLTGANGTYTIESNLVLTVDQANDDHEAKLVFASNNGEAIFLKVTFTPADNAPQEIKNNAVESEFYFTTSTIMQYKVDAEGNYDENGTPVDIFTFSNPSDGNFSPNVEWNKETNGTFTYTLDGDQLADMIKLTVITGNDEDPSNDKPFVLDTKSEHDAFRTALSGNIVARVTDGTVTE